MHCMSPSYTYFTWRKLLRKELLRMSGNVYICTSFIKSYKIHLRTKPWLILWEKSFYRVRQIVTSLFTGKFVGIYINDNPVSCGISLFLGCQQTKWWLGNIMYMCVYLYTYVMYVYLYMQVSIYIHTHTYTQFCSFCYRIHCVTRGVDYIFLKRT